MASELEGTGGGGPEREGSGRRSVIGPKQVPAPEMSDDAAGQAVRDPGRPFAGWELRRHRGRFFVHERGSAPGDVGYISDFGKCLEARDPDAKTTPWLDEQYLVINRRRYAYYWQDGEMIVAEPGGRQVALSTILGKSIYIVPPEQLRLDGSPRRNVNDQ